MARLNTPIRPTKILGVGTNYRAHAVEMGKPLPDEPLLFMKPRSALIGDGEAIIRPTGTWRVDFEGELGVVIGKRCRKVAAENALTYVQGYTIVNDVSVRDLQKKDRQFTRAKGFDTFCPVGPWIETEVDPSALRLTTRQNGVLKQDSSTSDMIFSVAELSPCTRQWVSCTPAHIKYIARGSHQSPVYHAAIRSIDRPISIKGVRLMSAYRLSLLQLAASWDLSFEDGCHQVGLHAVQVTTSGFFTSTSCHMGQRAACVALMQQQECSILAIRVSCSSSMGSWWGGHTLGMKPYGSGKPSGPLGVCESLRPVVPVRAVWYSAVL